MVFGTLAPTLAQAVVASSDKSGWVQVCSTSGMFWVRADAEPAGQGESGADMSAACPWCSLSAGAVGLPASPALALAISGQGSPAPTQLQVDPHSRVWTPAKARAPPRVA